MTNHQFSSQVLGLCEFNVNNEINNNKKFACKHLLLRLSAKNNFTIVS